MKATAIGAFLGFFFLCVGSLGAESATVRLKDGTVLKGTHVGKEEGRWVLESEALGKVVLKNEDIQSIEYTAGPGSPETPAATPSAGTPVSVDQAATEKKVLSDPTSMAAIMNMVQDPEIKTMLSDPEFVKKVQAFDVAGLEKDPRFIQFMERADVQGIAQRVSQDAEKESSR